MTDETSKPLSGRNLYEYLRGIQRLVRERAALVSQLLAHPELTNEHIEEIRKNSVELSLREKWEEIRKAACLINFPLVPYHRLVGSESLFDHQISPAEASRFRSMTVGNFAREDKRHRDREEQTLEIQK